MAGHYDRDFPALPSSKHGKQRRKATTKKETRTLTGATATINDLPDELMLEILEYLPGIDVGNFQLLTLVNLSQVNRRFHRLVAEELFHSYDSHFCEPYLFLRTMSSNPHLAELVQHADVSYGEWAHHDRKRHIASAQDKKTVKEGLRALNIPGWKNWAANCNAQDIRLETLHSAVLMHTPNLNSLIIRSTHLNYYHKPEWLALIKRAATGAPYGNVHRFEHLHSIDVYAGYFSIRELGPLFRLSALRHLIIREVVAIQVENGNVVLEMQRQLPASSSQLDALEFEFSWIDMDILSILVASPQRLKSLKLDLAMNSIEQPIDDDVDNVWGSAKLCELLCTQKASLETLWINTDALSEDLNFHAVYLGRTLQDFSALKHLRCPLSILMGVRLYKPPAFFELLPPSLESFHSTIRQGTDDHRSLELLEQLVAALPSDASQLKEVVFYAPLYADWFTYDWAPLAKSFAAADIALIVLQDENEALLNDAWDSTNSSRSSDEVSLYSNED